MFSDACFKSLLISHNFFPLFLLLFFLHLLKTMSRILCSLPVMLISNFRIGVLDMLSFLFLAIFASRLSSILFTRSLHARFSTLARSVTS